METQKILHALHHDDRKTNSKGLGDANLLGTQNVLSGNLHILLTQKFLDLTADRGDKFLKGEMQQNSLSSLTAFHS